MALWTQLALLEAFLLKPRTGLTRSCLVTSLVPLLKRDILAGEI